MNLTALFSMIARHAKVESHRANVKSVNISSSQYEKNRIIRTAEIKKEIGSIN